MPDGIANASKDQKLHYLHMVAAKIIDELVLQKCSGIDICDQLMQMQEQEDKHLAKHLMVDIHVELKVVRRHSSTMG